MNRRSLGASVVRHAVLIPVALIFIFPFLWMLLISLTTEDKAYQYPPNFIPAWNFGNYVQVFEKVPWGRYFTNTIFMATAQTLLVVITSSLAGYAFANMNFPIKAALFGLLLAVYMVPAEVTLVPNFIIIKDLGWFDSYQAQIVPFAASVFGIFLMRQFFLGMPKDLWEAAQLDGCKHLRYLFTIALPLAQPALVTVSLFTFVLAWNSFIWPLIITNSADVRPLQVGLSYFSAGEGTHPTLLAAGAFMTTLPILVVFLFAQRQLVGGIASTGIRG